MAKRRDRSREKNPTDYYLGGRLDEDEVELRQRFSQRSAGAQRRKMERTALLRVAEEQATGQIDALPVGQVVQVYSLFSEVEAGGVMHLCVMRRTLSKLAGSALVVGDRVRLRTTGTVDESGRPEAVIEQILPRRTVLTRAESFKAVDQQPIVANAERMLIVVSLHEPEARWGLVDRMVVAAQSGGLRPIVCLNKVDLGGRAAGDLEAARQVLAHYERLGIATVQSSVPAGLGIDRLREVLDQSVTVLAGHSGVGKSSLIHAVEPSLSLRIGAISRYTGKGRHTTTSARRYDLPGLGQVIDTPGVKLFGLWGVTRQSLLAYFPDVDAGTAPPWRRESYERILQGLPESPA